MVKQTELDALAERIRTGIRKRGVHMLFQEELMLIFHRQAIKSEREKLMRIAAFALSYGFEVDVSNPANIAVFKRKNLSAAA